MATLDTVARTARSEGRPRKIRDWAVLLLLVSGLVAIFVWMMSSSPAGSLNDYGVFYSAGRVILKGERYHLYDHRTYLAEFAAIGKTDPGAFIHPAFEALVFVPFASLPYGISYVVWKAFNLLALAASVLLLRPYLRGFRTLDGLAGMAIALFPVGYALPLGQDCILLLLLLTAAFVSLRDRSEFRAGAFLALGLFRPQFIGPFLLMLAVKRRWKALAAFAVVGFFLGVLSLLLVGWHGSAAFLHVVSNPGGREETHVALDKMPNLRGLVIFLLGNAHVALFVALGSGALLVWCAKRWSASSSIEQSFALAVLASVLTAYYSWVYDLDLLILTSILDVKTRRKLIVLGLALLAAEVVIAEILILAGHSVHLPFSLLVPITLGWTLILGTAMRSNRAMSAGASRDAG